MVTATNDPITVHTPALLLPLTPGTLPQDDSPNLNIQSRDLCDNVLISVKCSRMHVHVSVGTCISIFQFLCAESVKVFSSFFRLLLYLCCWRPVKTTSIHQQVMLKTPQHPKHNPNCFPTRFHVLIVYHGHPNGMKLKQGDGSFSLCLKLYCSRSLHWGWWRDYSWLSWPGRSAEKLKNAQVVLRFELTLHGWITLT